MTDEPSSRDNDRPDAEIDRVETGETETDAAISADDERLFALASRIDQGHPIDWDAAERDARSDRERAIVAEMRLLADVARVGRERTDIRDDRLAEPAPGDLQGATAGGTTESGPAPDMSVPPPRTWGSLAIHEPIGHGAFSTVYRARDNLGRLVALKLFPLQPERGVDWAARLLHEGRLLARLRHENVVSVYGADQGDGYVGLWMELVKGRTLEEELHTRVRFSAEEAAHVGRVLCRALAAVHHAGLLHRDIKAHNVMRDEAGRIVLMDFGSGQEAPIDDATAGVDLAGTPLYLAPEVFAGQPASIASDIYSLGVLLFHLVSDRYPIEGTNRAEIQRAHRERRRLWLRDARPDLPDAFVRVVERALAPDRTQRYQSAGELEDALAGISTQPAPSSSGGSSVPTASTPSASDNAGHSPHSPKEPARYRWQMIAAGASLVLAMAIVLVVLARTIPLPGWATPTASAHLPSSASAASSVSTSPSASGPTSRGHAPADAGTTYAVHATFYKQDDDGRDTPLASGDRVAPGDRLGLRVTTSRPAYVYVANQDEEGDGFLLYPLRADVGGPLEAQHEHRLPLDDTGHLWQVTSPGVREHFLVFVSPTMLKDFDKLLRELPRAEAGRPVTSARIPRSLIGQTRGVGGLAKADRTPPSGLKRLFDQARPLSGQQETVEGEWIRELTLVNPVSRGRPAPSGQPATH